MLKVTRILHLSVLVSLIVLASSGNVSAAGKPSASDPKIGNDVSYPQCGKTLPTNQAYGIVGVNGGTANTTNKCLAVQLQWAAKSAGTNPNQPKVQLYVNTGNPGEVLEEYSVETWPTSNLDSRGNDTLTGASNAGVINTSLINPHGACKPTPGAYREYTNNMACSWQYGWNRAVVTVDARFKPAALSVGMSQVAADYKWWLDVETMNSWQTAGNVDAVARNTASIEGMKQFYASEGVSKVGIYSTGYQWNQIVGNTLDTSTTGANLKGLESWLAGSANSADAAKRCTSLKGLTGGPVVMNQYVSRNLDYNYSCI